jgi:hypothetical protein
MLNDLPIVYSVDVHVVDLEGTTGRAQHPDGWMIERSSMGASARDQVHYCVSADDLVLDFEPQVREGRTPGGYDLGDESPGVWASVAEVRELIAEEALYGVELPVVPHLIEVSPNNFCVIALGGVRSRIPRVQPPDRAAGS